MVVFLGVRNNMKRIKFKNQMIFCMVIIFIGVFVSGISQQGVISKIAWTIAGCAFIFNPVAPQVIKERFRSHKMIMRLIGACWIIMAWIFKFTGY